MTIREIVTLPDPVLTTPTRRVTKFDESLHRLLDDMWETMFDAPGVGLAANQIGVPFRIAVLRAGEEYEPIELINPEIVRAQDEYEVEWDACLSIPGYWGKSTRFRRVRVRALDRNGKEFRIRAEGLLAHVLQHEIDHLEGRTYIDRLANQDLLFEAKAEDDEDEAEEE